MFKKFFLIIALISVFTSLFCFRYYDPQIARWTSVDPADEFYSPYVYCANSPTNFVDPDGTSTHCANDGEILYVNPFDGDFGVYQYPDGEGPSVLVGKTEFIDTFSYSVGYRLCFEYGDITPFLNAIRDVYVINDGVDFTSKVLAKIWKPASVAYNSFPKKGLDVKTNFLTVNDGYLVNGIWSTGQDIGNKFAGGNSRLIGMSYLATIMSAGALHMIDSRSIRTFNLKYFGETNRAGRQIESGYWNLLP